MAKSGKKSVSHKLTMLDMRKYGFPNIPLLGEYSFRQAVPALTPHRHKGAMEICYLRYGRQTYEVGGRDFVLGPGDIFISFPDELHSSGQSPQEVGGLYWLQLFIPKAGKSFLGMSVADSAILAKKLRNMPVRFFKGLPVIRENFAGLFMLVENLDGPLKKIRFKNLFVQLLLNILIASEHAYGKKPLGIIQTSLDYINANLDKPLPICELAKRVNLSESWFKARFKKELGMPPAEYVMRKKIDLATNMLQSGKQTITEIAYHLCFSSSQHFSATYKRFTGKQPREAKTRL